MYAQRNRTTTPLQAAAATGRLTLRANSPVERIDTDARTGKANGVTYIDKLSGKRHQVHADVVVVCASTMREHPPTAQRRSSFGTRGINARAVT